MNPADALADLPPGLRLALLAEYKSIIQNFSEHRWSPSELSGGRFCEIVYTILDGHAKGNYATTPTKPPNLVAACRQLEANNHVPRSFQILIPRILPAIFEVRNNRNVGHVGGDVDPSHMDATFIVSNCNWVMAELTRVYHNVPTETAQRVVDALVERRIPLVWEGEEVRRVLDPKMSLVEQVLLLLATSTGAVATSDLSTWVGSKDKAYFKKQLRKLHDERLIELSTDESRALILPPGSNAVADILSKRRSAH
jgi:hypothetical protein